MRHKGVLKANRRNRFLWVGDMIMFILKSAKRVTNMHGEFKKNTQLFQQSCTSFAMTPESLTFPLNATRDIRTVLFVQKVKMSVSRSCGLVT